MGVGAAVVVLVGGFAVVVASGILRGAVGSEPVPSSASSSAVVAEAGLYVHVEGAVLAPGLYVLPTGARVVDAVGAAGGLADDADPAALNLARPVTDGEQLHVPRAGETPPVASGGAAGDTTGADLDGVVNLNTADVAALDTLPRIGPAIAQRIIDWREQNGAFTSVDDLLAVPGIGEKMLAGLRDLVRV
jgi:competence protein ComEA